MNFVLSFNLYSDSYLVFSTYLFLYLFLTSKSILLFHFLPSSIVLNYRILHSFLTYFIHLCLFDLFVTFCQLSFLYPLHDSCLLHFFTTLIIICQSLWHTDFILFSLARTSSFFFSIFAFHSFLFCIFFLQNSPVSFSSVCCLPLFNPP